MWLSGWPPITRELLLITKRKARPRVFWTGTLVLKKVLENTAEARAGKFQVNWEGPYVVTKVGDLGAYHLQNWTTYPYSALGMYPT